ncbi:MAG: Hsp70 family protein, partial [Deltaproteobacteria bacterium]|nr:Hsp70 family protein [Deltaproteobacteria bacterium]
VAQPGRARPQPAPAPAPVEVPIASDDFIVSETDDMAQLLPVGLPAAVVGLDFGQNSCRAAVGIDELVYMIPDATGRKLFPTAICYPRDGAPQFAWKAKQCLGTDPTRTVTAIKRILGRSYTDPMIAGQLFSVAFRTAAGPDGGIDIAIDDKRRPVEAVCADILRFMRDNIEQRLAQPANRAVFTHPVAFSDEQKQALCQAAELAGFEVAGLLDEPTAVALAYGLGQRRKEIIAVYDFGGGTFDFTVMEIHLDDYRVLGRAGDAWLGGDDFDLALAQALGNIFWRKTKIELQNLAVEWQRLLRACESAKQYLSDHLVTEVLLRELITSPQKLDFVQRIDRAGFERITANYFGQTLGLCQEALEQAGLKPGDVDQLVMSGGTTRIPFVRQGLTSFFGKPATHVLNPEEAVALGAGLHAARLCGHSARRVASSRVDQRTE